MEICTTSPAFSVVETRTATGPWIPYGASIPIPDDPNLDGLVVLGQVAALHPDGTIAMTDVTGTTIRSQSAGLALRSGGDSQSADSAERAAREGRRREAASRWMSAARSRSSQENWGAQIMRRAQTELERR